MAATARPANSGGVDKGRDYSDEEREFLVAVERWRRQRWRRFVSCAELLALAVALGYRKVADPEPLPRPRPSIP